MKYSFYALTDVGRCRKNNEDSVTFDVAAQLAVLADGMGGYNAGEVASGMATSLIKSELVRCLAAAKRPLLPADLSHAIEICVANANNSILQAASSDPQYAGMGTTLVLAVFQNDALLLGHIGDSRCYRWRAGELTRLTKDHSFLQEQIDAGLLSVVQAQTAPHKNLVTRALGVEVGVRLELHSHQVLPEDIYLLCSDGLSDMLHDRVIAAVLQTGGALAQLAGDLVAAANQNGGRDNIAVLLVRASAVVQQPGLIARWLGQR